MFLVSLSVILIAMFIIELTIFSDWAIDSPTISMTLTFSLLLSTEFNQVVTWLANTEQEMVSVERVRQYFQNETENLEQVPEKGENDFNEEAKDCSVVFNKVYMSYNKDPEEQDKVYALKNINFKVRKGEKIAFCGRYNKH